MKLTTKFTLWYFGIMLFVLLIGGAIVYYEIQWKISQVEVSRHQRLNDIIAEQVRQWRGLYRASDAEAGDGHEDPGGFGAKGDEHFLYPRAGVESRVSDQEYRLLVTSFYTINGEHYRMTTYSFIPSFYQLLPGVVDSFKWILLLLLVLVIVSGWADLQIYPGAVQADDAGDPVFRSEATRRRSGCRRRGRPSSGN